MNFCGSGKMSTGFSSRVITLVICKWVLIRTPPRLVQVFEATVCNKSVVFSSKAHQSDKWCGFAARNPLF